jgi:hypothetical protein
MNFKLLINYLTATIGFIISSIGFIIPKIAGGFAWVGIVILFKEALWSYILGLVAFIFIGVILFPVGKYITKKGILLSEYAQRPNFSYLQKYGRNYKRPTFEDFGLEQNEYFSYNRRFVIDEYLVAILTIALTILLSLKIIKDSSPIKLTIIFVIVTVNTLIVRFLVKGLNIHFAKKYPQHSKVVEYSTALKIYQNVQAEIKANKNGLRFDKVESTNVLPLTCALAIWLA